ncbi:hypothetical protein NQ317_015621 [Molorchus minor]|uniref:Uncharacterized protein n=1 Tax=Molorchus minor TaxID=1323400 RepID=A0ABQ9JU37_9CUCU|nr:hypothetical protein NQ317_015621 [Molorchus minor]
MLSLKAEYALTDGSSTPYDTPLTEPSTSFGQTTTSRRELLHVEQSKRRELIIEEDYNCEATEADRLHIHWISNAKTIGTGCVIICGRVYC